jgi:zinc transporter, ZIP family
MSDSSVDATAPSALRWLWLAVPLLTILAAISWLIAADPLQSFRNGAPPVEKLTFERVVLDGRGIHVTVRAGGSEPMRIAQVQVDDAYWSFVQVPPGPLNRGAAARLDIPYPWVLGEAHAVNVVTSTGTTFSHDIPVAVATPDAGARQLVSQALLGAFVGILPVAVGLMLFPLLRGVGTGGMRFLLALTVGLLAFLFVDSFEEALELADQAAPLYQGVTLVVLTAVAAFILLLAVSHRSEDRTGAALAWSIALGIGLHNLGEGLAIGGSFAAGAAGLGTFLVLGFTLHNVTEGIGIAAPLLRGKPPPLALFVGLALLAGGPAIIGMWLGSLAIAPQWLAITLAIGAGAIAQVIVELIAYLYRTSHGERGPLLGGSIVSGIMLGFAVMFTTAMLVKI